MHTFKGDVHLGRLNDTLYCAVIRAAFDKLLRVCCGSRERHLEFTRPQQIELTPGIMAWGVISNCSRLPLIFAEGMSNSARTLFIPFCCHFFYDRKMVCCALTGAKSAGW